MGEFAMKSSDKDEELSAARADPRQQWLPLTPEELEADALGSYNEAMRVLAERFRAGEVIPNSGYFARKCP